MIDSTELRGLADAAGLADAVIYLTSLDAGGIRIALDDGRPIYPASMIKVPLALAAALAAETSRTGWYEPVVVDDADMTFTDAPSPLEPGYECTVRELVELMITRSDNVATNVLMDHLDRAQATADVVAAGFAQTAFRRKLSGRLPLIDDRKATGRNTHPAREAAALFEAIARGGVPSSALLMRFLGEQVWNTKLSAGLERGDRFAHKTGDTDDTSHDGGILQLAGGERYAIVVYTELASNEATDAKFAAFMRALRPSLACGKRE